MPFIETVKYYILGPIGLSESYDVNTVFPPFTARGFIESNEDLLLIGSTLASGGVSPKTRLRVFSTYGDKSFPFGIVDGYGMGVWRTKGWRTKGLQKSYVRGWLAMGSSAAVIYFDTDDLVVGMCAPKNVRDWD